MISDEDLDFFQDFDDNEELSTGSFQIKPDSALTQPKLDIRLINS